VFHPAFGHFAAAYGLEQVAVEDQGHEPGPRSSTRPRPMEPRPSSCNPSSPRRLPARWPERPACR
jgi:hypothetical protein